MRVDGKKVTQKHHLSFYKSKCSRSLNLQYGTTQVDRLLFLIGQGLIAAINAYTCLTYMESGGFACYRKTMSYDERKNGCAQFAEMMKKEANMRNLSIKWSVYATPRK